MRARVPPRPNPPLTSRAGKGGRRMKYCRFLFEGHAPLSGRLSIAQASPGLLTLTAAAKNLGYRLAHARAASLIPSIESFDFETMQLSAARLLHRSHRRRSFAWAATIAITLRNSATKFPPSRCSSSSRRLRWPLRRSGAHAGRIEPHDEGELALVIGRTSWRACVRGYTHHQRHRP